MTTIGATTAVPLVLAVDYDDCMIGSTAAVLKEIKALYGRDIPM
jgi:hypothetical protein